MAPSLPAELAQSFTHQTAQVNGVHLHYVIGGQGLPVVLLHGWPETWYMWRKIMPALAETYTVIAPDLRGLGDSEKTPSGYDAPTLAEDIFGLVHALGLQKVALVGHDVGVSVAYAYAAQHREDVRSLVLLDVPIEGFGREEFAKQRGVWLFGFFQVVGLAEALVEGRVRPLLEWGFTRGVVNHDAFTQEDIDEYVRCYSAPDALRAGFEYFRAFPSNAQRFQEYARQKLRIPTLGLGGEYSGGSWPFYSLSLLAENPSGGIIPQCGHFVVEERPEVLIQRLTAFFSEHEH
jgi:pimeloyl-ACP methyl ester carboxylesterase